MCLLDGEIGTRVMVKFELAMRLGFFSNVHRSVVK